MAVKVTDFWMDPENPPLTIKSIKFGYVEKSGKKREYTVTKYVTEKSNIAFHHFIFALIKCKENSISPWPILGKWKNDVWVKPTVFPDESKLQTELGV